MILFLFELKIKFIYTNNTCILNNKAMIINFSKLIFLTKGGGEIMYDSQKITIYSSDCSSSRIFSIGSMYSTSGHSASKLSPSTEKKTSGSINLASVS